ncbi:MAG: hypothetical protein RJA99_1594 [Pseudomonadota bacterium]
MLPDPGLVGPLSRTEVGVCTETRYAGGRLHEPAGLPHELRATRASRGYPWPVQGYRGVGRSGGADHRRGEVQDVAAVHARGAVRFEARLEIADAEVAEALAVGGDHPRPIRGPYLPSSTDGSQVASEGMKITSTSISSPKTT